MEMKHFGHPRKRRHLAVLVVLILILIHCTAHQDDPIQKYGIENLDHLGIDSKRLARAYQKADDLGFVYAMIVERGGEIAAEYYFAGKTENDFFNVKSVSKSILSALLGIAMEKGIISGLDQRISGLFPEYHSHIRDTRFHQITIGHLLMMRGGIDRDRTVFSRVFYSANPLKAIFEESLLFEPGSDMIYSTPLTHLLACSLSRLLKEDLKVFADQHLHGPLEISVDDWEIDPQGNRIGGNNMRFQTRELVKFGRLYADGGIYKGQQIVPKDWIEQSIENSLTEPGGNWGALEEIGYGYLWWLGKIRGYDVYTAIGYGGQFVMHVPELDLLIVTNADSEIGWDSADAHERAILDIIRDHILPAIGQ